jgi:hypothetical protein
MGIVLSRAKRCLRKIQKFLHHARSEKLKTCVNENEYEATACMKILTQAFLGGEGGRGK